jgi:Fe-S-cluster containining protein
MLLSNADLKRLDKAGRMRREYARYDRHGFVRLRNRQGFCVFYDTAGQRCGAYEYRPSGCRVYPIMYVEREGIRVDDLCPMKDTVTPTELRRKGREVVRLLQKIDGEARSRRSQS